MPKGFIRKRLIDLNFYFSIPSSFYDLVINFLIAPLCPSQYTNFTLRPPLIISSIKTSQVRRGGRSPNFLKALSKCACSHLLGFLHWRSLLQVVVVPVDRRQSAAFPWRQLWPRWARRLLQIVGTLVRDGHLMRDFISEKENQTKLFTGVCFLKFRKVRCSQDRFTPKLCFFPSRRLFRQLGIRGAYFCDSGCYCVGAFVNSGLMWESDE